MKDQEITYQMVQEAYDLAIRLAREEEDVAIKRARDARQKAVKAALRDYDQEIAEVRRRETA